MKKFFCAFDLGSSKIKFLIAKLNSKGKIDLLFKGEKESQGIKKGIVLDPKKLSQVLKEISKEVSKILKREIPPAFVNVGGSFLSIFQSKGLVSVSRADQKISEEDVERVLKAAQALNLGQNREILEIFPQKYIIDNQLEVENPVGLKGLRLEVEALILTGILKYYENLKRAFLISEIEVLDFIPSFLALEHSLLKEREKEIGVCLLNLGAETTEISVFKDGKIVHFSVLPIGSLSITNKIAIFLKTDFESAERIKIEFGKIFSKKKKIEIKEKKISFFSSQLSREIKEGYLKIFDQVKKEIKKFLKENLLPGGIVLTGGGAKIEGIAELSKQKFKLYSKIGKPKILDLKDPAFSVCSGLILAGIEKQKKASHPSIFSKILNFFKGFLP